MDVIGSSRVRAEGLASCGGAARRWSCLLLLALAAGLGGLGGEAVARPPFAAGPGWGGGFGVSRGAWVGGGWRGAVAGPGFAVGFRRGIGFGGCWPARAWNGCWPGTWGYGGCFPVVGTAWCGTGFAVGGTRFWSGSTFFGVPAWGGCFPVAPFGWCAPTWCGPAWCAPVWGGPAWCAPAWGGPAWGGPAWGAPAFCGGGASAWYGGWNVGTAQGWNAGPARGWNLPCAAVAPRRPAAALLAGQAPAEHAFGGRDALGGGVIDAAVAGTIRSSNAEARRRAARLVKLGDGHLRDAVDEPIRLAKAIDAYRRAAAIAPDQPDVHLRHSIALVAAGKRTAADAAIARAVAIDARLAEPAGGTGAEGAAERLAGLPAPTALDVRGGRLLARIFDAGGPDGAAPEGNWIARSWAGRPGTGVLVASRP
ncbi:MAG: hypothetical protein ACKO3G_04770 [Planctomycetaceae bacterium]